VTWKKSENGFKSTFYFKDRSLFMGGEMGDKMGGGGGLNFSKSVMGGVEINFKL